MSELKKDLYTISDCTDESLSDTCIEGRYIILKEEFFKDEFKNKKYQLVIAAGGFGCDPSKMGNAIFVKELFPDGESYRIERCNREILGIASDSTVAKYKEEYL